MKLVPVRVTSPYRKSPQYFTVHNDQGWTDAQVVDYVRQQCPKEVRSTVRIHVVKPRTKSAL